MKTNAFIALLFMTELTLIFYFYGQTPSYQKKQHITQNYYLDLKKDTKNVAIQKGVVKPMRRLASSESEVERSMKILKRIDHKGPRVQVIKAKKNDVQHQVKLPFAHTSKKIGKSFEGEIYAIEKKDKKNPRSFRALVDPVSRQIKRTWHWTRSEITPPLNIPASGTL